MERGPKKPSYTEAESERSALLAAIRGHSGTHSLRKVRRGLVVTRVWARAQLRVLPTGALALGMAPFQEAGAPPTRGWPQNTQRSMETAPCCSQEQHFPSFWAHVGVPAPADLIRGGQCVMLQVPGPDADGLRVSVTGADPASTPGQGLTSGSPGGTQLPDPGPFSRGSVAGRTEGR